MCAAARFVCLYDVEEKILLRRVQISNNRSLDGVLDQLNSKHMTDAGPAALLDDAESDEDELLPPTTSGAVCDTATITVLLFSWTLPAGLHDLWTLPAGLKFFGCCLLV